MKVKFVSSNPYLGVPDEEFDKLVFCVKGLQELVIECDDEKLKEEIKNLPSEYLVLRLSEVTKYLDSKNIPYEIDLSNSVKI